VDVPPPSLFIRIQRLSLIAFAVALFFLVAGLRWATIGHFGSDMPNWDQWDAEAAHLLIPWFEEGDFAGHLFHPHNEHRVVLTKLQSLALVLLSGQWDARLQCVVNAGLCGLLVVALWLCSRRWVAARWHLPLFVLLAFLFGLPLAWENILGGFHSQQYWLIGLSFAAIVTLPFASPWSACWWLGAFSALLALGSMASGFLASAVVASVVGFRLLRRETTLAGALPTLTLATALVCLGALTHVTAPHHEPLKAKTLHDFVFNFVHSLQWPLRFQHWAGAVLWFPWLLVCWRVVQADARPGDVRSGSEGQEFRSSPRFDPRAPQTIVAVGGWVLLQFLATAYARGAEAHYPAPRYMDTLALGAFVNAVALAWLGSPPASQTSQGLRADSTEGVHPRRGDKLSFGLSLIGLAWLLTLGAGLHETATRQLTSELPETKAYHLEAGIRLRSYLATNDPAELEFPVLPYPSAQVLMDRLGHPSLRELMPVGVRAPLALQPSAEASPHFATNAVPLRELERGSRHGLSPATPPLGSHRTWGSFGAGGPVATGLWISDPLSSPMGGWLKFEAAGQLGEPGTSLELHDALTGVRLGSVLPSRIPGDSWRAAYVRAPQVPFVVVARDSDPTRWMAFSAPVEMSPLSYWAWRATQHGLLVAIIAAGLAGIPAVLGLFLRGRH